MIVWLGDWLIFAAVQPTPGHEFAYSPLVPEFARSGLESAVITCQPQGFAEHKLPLTPFRLRLVRVALPNFQRFEKTMRNFMGMLTFAATLLWLR